MIPDKRDEYIFQWNNYASGLAELTFTPDRRLSREIRDIIRQLHTIIPKIANTKNFNGGTP